MGDIGIDVGSTTLGQGCRGVAQSSCRVDDVVDEDAVAPGDLPDDVHHLRNTCPLTALVDNGKVGIEAAGNVPGAHDAPDIGGDNDQVLARVVLSNVLHQYRGGEQIVGRDIEETLDLSGMEVEGQHPIGTGRGDH